MNYEYDLRSDCDCDHHHHGHHPIHAHVECIGTVKDNNYDTLKNKPIVNLEGTQTEPVILSALKEGIYKVKGYYMSPDSNFVTISSAGLMVVVDSNNLTKEIKVIGINYIYDYNIDFIDQTIEKSSYLTDKFLKDHHYVTEEEVKDEVSKQIAALEIMTREETESLIDKKLDERIIYATNRDIEDLFDE